MTSFQLSLPESFVQSLAERAAELAVARLEVRLAAPSPYLSVMEAADYLRCDRQRIYDLTSSGRLSKVCDGTRVLLRRDELDEYLAAGARSRARSR